MTFCFNVVLEKPRLIMHVEFVFIWPVKTSVLNTRHQDQKAQQDTFWDKRDVIYAMFL